MRIIEIRFGFGVTDLGLGFLPRAFGSKMAYNCSAIFIE